MPGLKYLVPALALAGSAFAQCSTKGTMTITNSAQATQLASCTTFTGDIVIDKKAADAIALDGVKEINGDVTVSDAKLLTGLSASNLQTIKGELKLEDLVNISSLSFPMLTEVDSIFFQSLGPGLTSPVFSSGITTINDLVIDQCDFESLAGLTPNEANSVMLTNNQFISDLTLPLKSVKGDVIVRGNTASFSLRMPKLTKAGNIELNNCSSISVPELEEVATGISIVGNTIKGFSLPKLKTAGSFTIDQNDNMKSLSVPQLTNVTGAFSVEQNTKFTGALNFPKMEMITGAPKITGSFSALNMPSIMRIQGAMVISSTKNIDSTCSRFDKLSGTPQVSHVTCNSATGKKPSKSSGGGGGSSGGSGSDSSSSSGGSGGSGGSGAAGHQSVSMGLILTVFAGVSAFFAVLC